MQPGVEGKPPSQWASFKEEVKPDECLQWLTVLDWMFAQSEQESMAVWRKDFLQRHPCFTGESDTFFTLAISLDPAIANFWKNQPGLAISRWIEMAEKIKGWLTLGVPFRRFLLKIRPPQINQ